MKKKAIIFDLDNTLYPVSSIGQQVFAPLMRLFIESGECGADLTEIELAIQRKPFQYVADYYSMSDKLKRKALALLDELTYHNPIATYPGYELIRALPQAKYLVTAGFTKLQLSKVEQLGIGNDFNGISIIDRTKSNDTKKDIFSRIMEANGYKSEEVIVIGDDPDSEIKDGIALGIDVIWLDSLNLNYEIANVPRMTTLRSVADYLLSSI